MYSLQLSYSRLYYGVSLATSAEPFVLIYFLSIGFPLSYGVFQNYYFNHPLFRNDKNLPLVGTLATSLMFLGGPFTTPLVKRYQRYQRSMIAVGWLLCVLSLVAASFATTTGALILTQGVLYGLGELILYYPVISIINEWFVEKRGMAYGIQCCATGFSGIVFPFVLEILLKIYGFATTLRGISVFLALAAGSCLPLFKRRVPPIKDHAEMEKTNLSFLKKPIFYLYAASNLFQGLDFYLPLLFLPSYATSIGLSAEAGALLLAVASFAQVIGQVIFGYLSDGRIGLHTLLFVSPFISAIAAFTLWGFASSLPLLIMFSIVYGLFAEAYAALWARMCTRVSDNPAAALASYSILSFEKGIGNVLSGPISAGLLSQTVVLGSYGVSRYENLILFTGGCMLLSALTMVAWYLKVRLVKT